MQTTRCERIWLSPNKNLSRLCHISKNLYNETNYIIRQEFTKEVKDGETRKWIRYNELYEIMKNKENLNKEVTFKQLPIQTSQQVLKLLDKNWKSFFKSIKEWKKNPDKFSGQPNLPRYKEKDGEFMLIFTNQQVKLRGNFLIFPKVVRMKVKTRFDVLDLDQVRILPKGIGYVLEIVYTEKVVDLLLNKDNVIGIDFGVRNLATIVNNIGLSPIVIKGGVVKSMNQFYNKEIARLSSIWDRQKIERTTKRGKELDDKRYRKFEDYFHKISRYVISYCARNDIGTIIIGYNKDWKQKIKIGKKNTQNFVSIPFNKAIQKISYKAEEIGIRVIMQEESHTSKCSFLDNEEIEHHEEYIGKRISRGLFRTSRRTIINADVNAGYNLIRKAIPNAFERLEVDGIEGVGLHPIRVEHLINKDDNVR